MAFRRPLPFREALASQQARAVLPTALSSAEIERIDADLLRRAQFSAKVMDATHLDELATVYREVLEGRLDVATGRLRIKQYLARTGYQAAPEKQGGLEDLASTKRVNLQIGTNVAMMRGLGSHLQGQAEPILDMWPAQELVRVTNFDAVARGTERDWGALWRRAGGPVTSAWPRMIALKDDAVWVALSRFGNPYPPFDFNSGMGLEDVSRREAMRLGLIDLNRRVEPDREALRDLAAGPRAALVFADPRLRAALEATGVGRFDAEGVFRAVDELAGGPLANREYVRGEDGRFATTAAIAAGNAAVEKALATKADVLGAMSRPETGLIDFRWGKEGDSAKDFAGGHGFAKIVAKHGAEQARLTPSIIAEGSITFDGPGRMVIKHQGHAVVLAKDFFGTPSNHWVVSSHDTSHGSKAGSEKTKGTR